MLRECVAAMRAGVKRLVMRASKEVGLFRIASRATRTGLRILCYHGTSLADEHRFLPQLFMSPDRFERRLRFLAERAFPVLPLGEALERLDGGTLPPRATVITIDDGFYGTYRLAWPMLRRFGFPATIYVTSYYCAKAHPVFGLTVEYVLWKTAATTVDLGGLGTPMAGQVAIADAAVRRRLAEQLSEFGERHCTEDERVLIARRLAERLGVDYDAMAESRILNLMTLDEVRELAATGADIQAHTHRHRFPTREPEARREIEDNRRTLEPLVGRGLEHFCYPSGEWFRAHWPVLAEGGMRSATTCDPGLNYRDTPRLALRRLLDGEHRSALEFEAEMCGYGTLLRSARARLGRSGRARPGRDGKGSPGLVGCR